MATAPTVSGKDALSHLFGPTMTHCDALVNPPATPSAVSAHLEAQAQSELLFLQGWLRDVWSRRVCPATGMSLDACDECRDADLSVERVMADPEILKNSRFVAGSNRPGPHASEVLEACLASLLRIREIYSLV